MLMRGVPRLLPVVLLLVVATIGCSDRDFVGPGATVDFAVFLVDGATDEDIGAVQDLLQETVSGTEESLVEGVQGLTTDFADDVIYVELSPGTTDQRSAELAAILTGDERVQQVIRDYKIPDSGG
jgi:hypothetical protein